MAVPAVVLVVHTESSPEQSGCPKHVIYWSQGLQSIVCLLFVRVDRPPPGKQPGQILIGSLYCGCHCHHHSHWEKHTTLTPRVLGGRMGTFRAIKLAMYTQHSREKATPSTHVRVQWELGAEAQATVWM